MFAFNQRLSPLCADPVRDDDGVDEEVPGPCARTACAGPSVVVVEAGEEEEEEGAAEGAPQILSVSLVPGVSSASP